MKKTIPCRKLRPAFFVPFIAICALPIVLWFVSYWHNFSIFLSAKNTASPIFVAYFGLEYRSGSCILESQWLIDGFPNRLKFGIPSEPYDFRVGEKVSAPAGIPVIYGPTVGMMFALTPFDCEMNGSWTDRYFRSSLTIPGSLGLYLPIFGITAFLLYRFRKCLRTTEIGSK